MTTDAWGQPVVGTSESLAAWNQAWEEFLHFHGDPIARLAPASEHDEAFVMGPVFTALYAVLAGVALDAPAVTGATTRARERLGAAHDRERGHVAALEHLVAGNFSDAAAAWHDLAADTPDFAAVRFAHDVHLHVGDADGRLRSSEAAAAQWPVGSPGHSFIQGQLAFALEEVGRYDEADRVGRAALAADPDDLWARHALAHVYESTDQQQAALDLLEGTDRWHRQDLLATHIWWHLALRHLSVGDTARVLAIHDDLLPTATTAFRLCDLTSLLWRVELLDGDVGDRWDVLADRWDAVTERHACAFLDLHAAMAFARRPDHPGAGRFMDGLARACAGQGSENDATFAQVVAPLVDAIGAFVRGDHERCRRGLDAVGARARRIGGSIAQRDVLELTRHAAGAHA